MRDDFTNETKRTIAMRVNWVCSNPTCRTVTSGPQQDATKVINIGVAAHISAASAGGARYDNSLSDGMRKHATNGIWLCQNCAKLVDNDPAQFPATLLNRWKADAEFAAHTALGRTASGVDSSGDDLTIEEIDLLCAAAEKGDIHVLKADIGTWIDVGGEQFRDDSDPAVAALYLDALRTLMRRGFVNHDEGILFVLNGRGFKLARALKESRDSYGNEDDDESLLYDQTSKLGRDKHLNYLLDLDFGEEVEYVVDSNYPVSVFIMASKEYESWRNDFDFDAYKEHLDISRITWRFRAESAGEFFLIVANFGSEKTRVDVSIRLTAND
jgi:hypothetical protein